MAMPWKLAKAKAAAIRADTTGQMLADLNRLFEACFRIQAQASLAAGRHIPMVVENVRGAQPWVGQARWSFGSFYLWGDVPALMPMTRAIKNAGGGSFDRSRPSSEIKQHGSGAAWWDKALDERRKEATAIKNGGARSFQSASAEGIKNKDADGYERSHPNAFGWKNPSTTSSNVSARKAASAMIAKIPEPLSRHIARTYLP